MVWRVGLLEDRRQAGRLLLSLAGGMLDWQFSEVGPEYLAPHCTVALEEVHPRRTWR